MIPRPPSCDGPDCEPTESGWLHYPDCATQQTPASPWPEDMAWATAMEDGYARRPVLRSVPEQRGGEAA